MQPSSNILDRQTAPAGGGGGGGGVLGPSGNLPTNPTMSKEAEESLTDQNSDREMNNLSKEDDLFDVNSNSLVAGTFSSITLMTSV